MIKSQNRYNLTTNYIIVDIIDFFQMITYNRFTFTGFSLLGNSTFLISFTSILMYRKLNRFLNLQIKKLNHKQLTQCQLTLKMSVFRREHHRITHMINFTDQTLISKVLFSGIMANSQFNIFISALILLNKLDGFNLQSSLASLLTEFLCVIILLCMMVNCNQSIYSSKKYLATFQMALGQYQIRDKIHHQRFYESVSCKPHLGFSVGPFGSVTKYQLYKVCTSLHSS